MAATKLMIDFEGCKTMLESLQKHSGEIKASAAELKKAADPEGVYQGDSAGAYDEALANYVKEQEDLDAAMESLIAIVKKFTGAVEEGDANLAASILNG